MVDGKFAIQKHSKIIKYLFLLVVILFALASCNSSSPTSSYEKYSTNLTPEISVKPVTIKGASFANSREKNVSIIEKTVGCKFHNDGREKVQHSCCFKPYVYDDGSTHCIDYDVHISDTYNYFRCHTYSSCQFDREETKQMLTNEFDIRFVSSCGLSKLGERVCVQDDYKRTWTNLGYTIKVERYKFQRSGSF